jgi:hypothetical protein
VPGYWSIEDIDNYEELWRDEKPQCGAFSVTREASNGRTQSLDVITTTLIWSLLPAANIEEITKENTEEVFIRIRMVELSRDPSLKIDGTPIYLTPRDIKRRIGLISRPDLASLPFEESTLAALRHKARSVWEAEERALRDEQQSE